ncbi:MAG: AMP-binding protein [Nevskia sp.]|jgi:acyl-CoA synthetase (AMP-forming)/AMP-acid ligase II|nr:AMP-binding protein [Nevskia sp.]
MMNFAHRLPSLPWQLSSPQTSRYFNLGVSARCFPDKPETIYYGSILTYAEWLRQVDTRTGFLQQDCGVWHGDRVARYLKNSLRLVIAFYAIPRANAYAAPVNPINLGDERRRVVEFAHPLRLLKSTTEKVQRRQLQAQDA